jgi:hypothetical protein
MAQRNVLAISFTALALLAVGCRQTPQTDSTTITGAPMTLPDAGVSPSSAGADLSGGVPPNGGTESSSTTYSPVSTTQPNVARNTAAPGLMPPDQVSTPASGAAALDAGAPRPVQRDTTPDPASGFKGSSFGNEVP